MGSQTLILHLGQLMATIHRRFFARQIGGYWTGIPPKCLQFGCWNSPSKEWGSMFNVCSPLVEWVWLFRKAINLIRTWLATCLGTIQKQIRRLGRRWAEEEEFSVLFVSFIFLLMNHQLVWFRLIHVTDINFRIFRDSVIMLSII